MSGKAVTGRRSTTNRGDSYDGEVAGAVPTALAQAVIAAIAICVCELIVAPVYASMVTDAEGSAVVALVPMAAMLALLGVGFVYTVGFVLLWVADIVGTGMGHPKGEWLVYGAAGLIGFGAWGALVVPSVLNSITAPFGGSAVGGGNLAAIAINSAATGAVAFALARLFADRLRMRRGLTVALAVVSVAVAAFGVYVMVVLFGRLY